MLDDGDIAQFWWGHATLGCNKASTDVHQSPTRVKTIEHLLRSFIKGIEVSFIYTIAGGVKLMQELFTRKTQPMPLLDVM